jgi:hypothetical protein
MGLGKSGGWIGPSFQDPVRWARRCHDLLFATSRYSTSSVSRLTGEAIIFFANLTRRHDGTSAQIDAGRSARRTAEASETCTTCCNTTLAFSHLLPAEDCALRFET